MSEYLNPPPPPAIVIIQSDAGGEFYSYLVQTKKYEMTGQRIQLINCRSACTMALSLKNVCVYPYSILKFHAPYYEDSKEIANREKKILFSMYPKKVQNRLGDLEKEFVSIRGQELINLGIRACKR